MQVCRNEGEHLFGNVFPDLGICHGNDLYFIFIEYIPECILFPCRVSGQFSVHVDKADRSVWNLDMYGGFQKCRIYRKNLIRNSFIIKNTLHFFDHDLIAGQKGKIVFPRQDHLLENPMF